MERFILKLNAHAIEFMKHNKDSHKLELAREFLGRAEVTLLNTDQFKQGSGVNLMKNKLLAITQSNIG